MLDVIVISITIGVLVQSDVEEPVIEIACRDGF